MIVEGDPDKLKLDSNRKRIKRACMRLTRRIWGLKESETPIMHAMKEASLQDPTLYMSTLKLPLCIPLDKFFQSTDKRPGAEDWAELLLVTRTIVMPAQQALIKSLSASDPAELTQELEKLGCLHPSFKDLALQSLKPLLLPYTSERSTFRSVDCLVRCVLQQDLARSTTSDILQQFMEVLVPPMDVDPPAADKLEIVEILDNDDDEEDEVKVVRPVIWLDNDSDEEVMDVTTEKPHAKGRVTLTSLLREPLPDEIQEVKSASQEVEEKLGGQFDAADIAAFLTLQPGRWANHDAVFQPILGILEHLERDPDPPVNIIVTEGDENILFNDDRILEVVLTGGGAEGDQQTRSLRDKWNCKADKPIKIIWPMEHANHWVLLVVHLHQRRIIMNCSLANWTLLRMIAARLKKLFEKVADALEDNWWRAANWKFIMRQPSVQTNGVDCGIFVATWAIMELVGISLKKVTQKHCEVALRTRFRFALMSKTERGQNSRFQPFNMMDAGFLEFA